MKKLILKIFGLGLTLFWNFAQSQSNCNGPNLLVNPSFEIPVVPNGLVNNVASGTVTGWTNLSSTPTMINVVRPNGEAGPGPTNAHDGNQYIDLAGGGGIMQQSFTLTEPTQLAFSGNFANRGVLLPDYTPGDIGIQILSTTEPYIGYASATGRLTAALGNNTWITLNGMTSVLQPGTYLYRFFAMTNFAHFDNFSLCVVNNAATACVERTVLKPETSWSATATSSFSNMPASNIIDGSVYDASNGTTRAWASGFTFPNTNDVKIIFDYGKMLDLVGFVYYPRIEVDQDIFHYEIEYSNDGTNFTKIQDGSISPQRSFNAVVPTDPSPIRVGAPLEVNFVNAVSARYLRLIIKTTHKINTYAAIAELLPIICGSLPPTDISCFNANILNTGTNTNGSSLGVSHQFDNHWEVAYAPDLNASATNALPTYEAINKLTFMPGIIVEPSTSLWDPSPFGNAQWITYTTSSRDVYGRTNFPDQPNSYFFRYRLNITDPYILPAFKLKLDFMTDNVLKNIYINGNGLAPQFGLPGGGLSLDKKTETNMNSYWQLGENEMIIQVYSQPPLSGFLGQNTIICPGLDFGDAPASYNVSRSTLAAGHIIEVNNLGQVTLKLGELIDEEEDGIASGASNDDSNGINDEDGLGPIPEIPAGDNPTIPSFTLPFTLTNITGAAANLCGWIDWNANGVFDDEERACTVVANGATTAELTWTAVTFNGPANGSTYGRFRLTSDELTSPNGAASNGEVEDYLIEFKPLPVTLVTFNAVKSENASVLQWATTAETNSDHFEVQHSTDGKEWNLIGRVRAQGESEKMKKYTFTDIAPNKGDNFYRLKMIDLDDTYAFSRIVNLTFEDMDVSLYPNPVSNRLFVNNFEKVRLATMHDISGKKVGETNKISEEGIDVSTMATGLYIVTLKYTDGTSSNHKVLIRK